MSKKSFYNKDIFAAVTFCYSLKQGDGFIDNDRCKCYRENKPKKECLAYIEKQEFHVLFKDLQNNGYSRTQIISIMEDIYEWDKTLWIQHNVLK